MNVRVENLSFAYRRGKPILDGLSFEAREGGVDVLLKDGSSLHADLVALAIGSIVSAVILSLLKKDRTEA